MIFNMLHKCWWLFLVWNLRLLKIEEEKGEFVVCYHSLYVLPDVGLSQIPTTWGNFAHAHIVITNWLIQNKQNLNVVWIAKIQYSFFVWLLRYLTGNLYFIQYLLYFQFVIFLLVGDGVCSPWLHQESLVTTFLWILPGIPVTNRITLQSWRGAGTGKFKGQNVANAIKVMHDTSTIKQGRGGGGGLRH